MAETTKSGVLFIGESLWYGGGQRLAVPGVRRETEVPPFLVCSSPLACVHQATRRKVRSERGVSSSPLRNCDAG